MVFKHTYVSFRKLSLALTTDQKVSGLNPDAVTNKEVVS
jgi:hypothetical protein